MSQTKVSKSKKGPSKGLSTLLPEIIVTCISICLSWITEQFPFPPDFIFLAINQFFMVLRLIIADNDKWQSQFISTVKHYICDLQEKVQISQHCYLGCCQASSNLRAHSTLPPGSRALRKAGYAAMPLHVLLVLPRTSDAHLDIQQVFSSKDYFQLCFYI